MLLLHCKIHEFASHSLSCLTPPQPSRAVCGPGPIIGELASQNKLTETITLNAWITIFLIVYFTRYIVFSIAVLPHSPWVVYYHLLFSQETRFPGVAPYSIHIGI